MKGYNVAVAGVTGAVGQEMLKILAERVFPVRRLIPLASARSRYKTVRFLDEELPVGVLEEADFSGIDLALFSPGAAVSRKLAPQAAAQGCVVIDNSSAFRQEADIPLIVPEVNGQEISGYKNRYIIANPNCTTIVSVVPLKPLHDYGRIRRIVSSSYQSASGAGALAMRELEEQVACFASGKPMDVKQFPHQLAFNVIPHIDAFQDNFYTKEEMKMVWETRRLLNDQAIQVSATCVRVPVLRSHSVSLNIETERKITREKARELLTGFPGVVVRDDPVTNLYPMPIYAAGLDPCFVGRIREDISCPNGLNLWVVGDQLRKGAALNAVQIAELLINHW
ncbi:MAG TPA: aspartate-semialdehyde dehydrogenase [Atribacteraceae bacterium]|nr:aspartate-semialdehyde dehydrogenase [Atribacteraceae bacterium]